MNLTEENNIALSAVNENGLNIQFIPSKRKTVKKITMVIEGDFTICNIEKVKRQQDHLLRNFDHIDVLLKNIQKLDLSAIQYLYTLRIEHAGDQKQVTLEAELGKELKELISSVGLLQLVTKTKLTA
jgi:ABC-type transporter Mla MlaB component